MEKGAHHTQLHDAFPGGSTFHKERRRCDQGPTGSKSDVAKQIQDRNRIAKFGGQKIKHCVLNQPRRAILRL